MSQALFWLYVKTTIRQIAGIEGISTGGQNNENIRYADDTVLIADSHEKLHMILERDDAASLEMGLKNNRGKTDCMIISKGMVPTCNIVIRNEQIQ